MNTRSLFLFLIACCSLGAATGLHADYSGHPLGKQFIANMVVEHGMNSADVTATLRKANRSEKVLELIQRPAEKRLEWKDYRKIFVTEERINAGVEFWRENKNSLERAQLRYGVPASIIVAIIGVETYYGRISGGFPALDAVATLAFDYPRRGEFFTRELAQLLLLAEENNFDLESLEGSYAGAFGMPQFISSSYRRYAIDFDNDKEIDLWNSRPDAIGSVANYFYRHNWKNGQIVAELTDLPKTASKLITDHPKPKTTLATLNNAGIYPKRKGTGKYALLQLQGEKGAEHWIAHHNFYVITRYNHSNLYAMAVHQLSQEIKSRI